MHEFRPRRLRTGRARVAAALATISALALCVPAGQAQAAAAPAISTPAGQAQAAAPAISTPTGQAQAAAPAISTPTGQARPSALLTGFAPSIETAAGLSATGAAAAGASVVAKARLIPGDGQAEAVWNSDEPATAFRVELLRGSTRVATQVVCGVCTWALFSGIGNGQEYRASVTPLDSAGKAGSPVVTEVTRPAPPPALPKTPSAAEDALDRAIETLDKRPELRGDQRTSGMAVNLAEGELIVGVTDDARYRALKAEVGRGDLASLVTVQPMKYSTAKLEDLMDRIAREAVDLRAQGVRVTGTSVNVQANKVIVDVLPATEETARVLAARYGHDTLILRAGRLHTRPSSNNPEHQPAPRIPSTFAMSWYGGINVMDADSDCTAGYIAKKENGELFLTTAGHCFLVGASAYDGAGTQIGTVTEALDGHGDEADAALISLNFPELATNQIIAQATGVWRNVTDEAERFVEGTRVCISGAASTIQKCAFNAYRGHVVFDDGTVQTNACLALNPLFPTDTYTLEGDSGSAVYRSLERDELRVYGILGGNAWWEEDDGTIDAGGFYYSFTTEIQEHFGVTALTTPVP